MVASSPLHARPEPASGPRRRAAVLGGLSAIGAGACWVVKGGAILLTGDQPPALFETAPLLMAVAALAVARQVRPGPARAAGSWLAAAAALAAVAVLLGATGVTELPEVVEGAAMATANLLVLVALVVTGQALRRHVRARLPLALGLATIPALVAGGALARLLGERALEVPLVALGGAWLVLGVRLARQRYGTTCPTGRVTDSASARARRRR